MSEVAPPRRADEYRRGGEAAFRRPSRSVSLFLNRSKRLAALAPGHELAPYLTFLAGLTRAQHEIGQDLPPATPAVVR